MSLVKIANGVASSLRPLTYDSEAHLTKLIFAHPDLLAAEGDPRIRSVATEVQLPEAGRLDVLLVDQSGLPIAVEVKLGANRESRREVVAQVFDYVSSLSLLTIDELDAKVGGSLEKALRHFEDGNGSFEERRRICARSLRAGQVRLVVTVDTAPPELVRIVRFMNEHTDLDVRLMAVTRYADGDTELLAPKLLVHSSQEDGQPGQRRLSAAKRISLDAAELVTQRVRDLIASGILRSDRTVWVYKTHCLVTEVEHRPDPSVDNAGLVGLDITFYGLTGGEEILVQFSVRETSGKADYTQRAAALHPYGEAVRAALATQFARVESQIERKWNRVGWRIEDPTVAAGESWTAEGVARTTEVILRAVLDVVPVVSAWKLPDFLA